VEQPNFLFEMDQTTQAIINAVLEASNAGRLGEISVPKAQKKVCYYVNVTLFFTASYVLIVCCQVLLGRSVPLAELRRLRRQFSKMEATMMNPPPVDAIGDTFVIYLNTNLA
jgi:hypothetical protein